MGSVVKSIGKAIKKVTSGIGRLVKKIGPRVASGGWPVYGNGGIRFYARRSGRWKHVLLG